MIKFSANWRWQHTKRLRAVWFQFLAWNQADLNSNFKLVMLGYFSLTLFCRVVSFTEECMVKKQWSYEELTAELWKEIQRVIFWNFRFLIELDKYWSDFWALRLLLSFSVTFYMTFHVSFRNELQADIFFSAAVLFFLKIPTRTVTFVLKQFWCSNLVSKFTIPSRVDRKDQYK